MSSFGQFGAQSTTPANTGFNFGVSTNTTATPSFASASFSGLNTNVSNSNLGGFGITPAVMPSNVFGGPAVPMSSASFTTFGQPTTSANFGIGGTTSFGFGSNVTSTALPSVPTAAPTTTIGLGGVDAQAASVNDPRTVGKKDSKAVLESVLPTELVITIESFKKHIKEQKSIREELSRASSKPITSIHDEIVVLQRQLSTVISNLQRSALTVTKLKQDTSQEQRNADIIHRTKDIPLMLQYENTAPSLYFHNLAINFEHQMQSYRQQIEQLERHLTFVSQPNAMTPDELTAVISRLHEAFVTLAAQLQTVHQQVLYQKEQFNAIQQAGQSGMVDIFQMSKTAAKPLPVTFLPSIPMTRGPATLPPVVPFAIGNAFNTSQQGSNLVFNQEGAHNASTGLYSNLASGLTGASLLNMTQQTLGSSFGLQNTIIKPIGK